MSRRVLDHRFDRCHAFVCIDALHLKPSDPSATNGIVQRFAQDDSTLGPGDSDWIGKEGPPPRSRQPANTLEVAV
jgi:hypothetical protein